MYARLRTKGEIMSGEIKFQKTTAYLIVGLFVALVFGGYLVYGTSSNSQHQAAISGTNHPSVNQPSQPNVATQPSVGGVQEVYLKASGSGYDPAQITVKKGIPVKLHFSATNAGCGSYMQIYGLDAHAISRNGEDSVVEFTPTQEGTYEYNCGMRMFQPGHLVVTP